MAPRRARLASNFDVVMACAAVLLLQSRIPQCAADKLSILRAWYGGPEGHTGKVESIHASQPWLWQTGERKGKIVTDIVKGYMRSDAALDFNPGRQACNDIFDFTADSTPTRQACNDIFDAAPSLADNRVSRQNMGRL
jgi:hypothetical protein